MEEFVSRSFINDDNYNYYDESITSGYYALNTVYNFMVTGTITREDHENNLKCAIDETGGDKMYGTIYFERLLSLTTIDSSKIISTSTNLIQVGIIGYKHIFRDMTYTKPYAVIFSKNGEYFTVLYKLDVQGNMYHIRDSSNVVQYKFDKLDSLIYHLDVTYGFASLTDDKIEYVRIDDHFDFKEIVIDYTGDEDGYNADDCDSDAEYYITGPEVEIQVEKQIETDHELAMRLQYED